MTAKKVAKALKAQDPCPPPAEQPELEKAAEKSDLVDLGLLKLGKNKVFVNLLPTKTAAVVVNYKNPENYYRISCVLPPNSYTINVTSNIDDYDDDDYDDDDFNEEENNFSRFLIDSPSLLFVAEYSLLPKPTISSDMFPSFYIYALNTMKEDRILCKPYVLSNTYEDGLICMGGFSPLTLRKAFNIYWGAGFNSELLHVVQELVSDYNPQTTLEHILNFHAKLLPHLDWDDITNMICGKDHWAAAKSAEGILITDQENLLKHIPNEFWRKDSNESSIIITLANLKEDIWHFESGNYKFQLAAKNVTTNPNKKKSTSSSNATQSYEEYPF
ncbi:hypothetical protein C4588_08045 [Candidatus Parcubacteria bacterium]|nr:MAG: hypothetical protein C4588_08045 [Candidatus Parcubacteria bacterium]